MSPSPRISVCPEPVNGSWFGNGVFPGVLKLRGHTGSGWTPNPMTSIPVRWDPATQRHTGQGHAKTEGEAGVMQPQAKEGQGCWQAQDGGRAKGGVFPGASRESTVLMTPWVQASLPQNCERTNFCCFKPLGPWYFVMVAWENYHSMLNKIFFFH